jgi:hypothetical protein
VFEEPLISIVAALIYIPSAVYEHVPCPLPMPEFVGCFLGDTPFDWDGMESQCHFDLCSFIAKDVEYCTSEDLFLKSFSF